MGAPLLLTKLSIPPPGPQHISRTRLLDLLPRSPALRLALVAAPAGFGKSTLLAEWARSGAGAGAAVAWYTLDPSDDDPLRFLAYLASACAGALGHPPELAELVSDLLRNPQTPPEPVLTGVLNALILAGRPCLLVLDDYHRVGSPAVHSAVNFLLEHLSAGVCLGLGTRADPPLALARLRARGQLAELRAADLRFTRAEQDAFFAGMARSPLADDEREQIETVSEGWAAGIQLIGLTLSRPTATTPAATVRQVLARHAHGQRQIFAYLAEEVFAQQPPEIQRFLLTTSILDRMCADLCDFVAGIENSALRIEKSAQDDLPLFSIPNSLFALAEIERTNLFLIPLDDERRWYRYHHLFADFLREHLQREWGELVPELHRRASAWFAAQVADEGLTASVAAVDHALAARDFAQAARLIDQAIGATMGRGELPLLLGWLGALPVETLQAWPHLAFYQVRVLFLAGEFAVAEQRLIWLEQILPAADPLHVAILIYRATEAAVCGLSQRALDLVAQAMERVGPGDQLSRARLAYAEGLAHFRAGRLAEADRACAETMRLAQAAGNLHLALESSGTRSITHMIQGRLRAADQLLRDALALAEAHSMADLPATALVYMARATLRYEWGDLEGAERSLRQGMGLRQRSGMVGESYLMYPILTQILAARGDLDAAAVAVATAEKIGRSIRIPTEAAMFETNLARAYLALGDLACAQSWAERCEQAREVGGGRPGSGVRGLGSGVRGPDPGVVPEREALQLVRVWLALGRSAEAAELAEQVVALARDGGRMGSQIEALAPLALALADLGQIEPAYTALAQTLTLAQPEGYRRTFVDLGPPMRELLVAYRASLSQAEAAQLVYCDQLLAAFPDGQPAADQPAPSLPAARSPQPLAEPLSERELEVLRLIAAGLTNEAIARRLVIALATVKTHTAHIFAKLGVNQRREAVEQARALGLL
jgi:LuxR family transcriptional regulator, maltose regulon positive regulatory protein